MKAIQYKISILLAGFLNGFNFFHNTPANSVSMYTGSLPSNFTNTIEVAGLSRDNEKLNSDWSNVKGDIHKSIDCYTNDQINAVTIS